MDYKTRQNRKSFILFLEELRDNAPKISETYEKRFGWKPSGLATFPMICEELEEAGEVKKETFNQPFTSFKITTYNFFEIWETLLKRYKSNTSDARGNLKITYYTDKQMAKRGTYQSQHKCTRSFPRSPFKI